ncbi:MAG: hypothetical protein AB1632_04720 [Nitrospirota bacterium]
MTKVRVNSGICGFSVTVAADRTRDKRINIILTTECEMVQKMMEDISVLDMRAAFAGHLANPVFRSAAMHLKHPACPVPSGILKALEVESGFCLPRNAAITFVSDV